MTDENENGRVTQSIRGGKSGLNKGGNTHASTDDGRQHEGEGSAVSDAFFLKTTKNYDDIASSDGPMGGETGQEETCFRDTLSPDQRTIHDALCESAWLSGLKFGWNAGSIRDDAKSQAEYDRLVASRAGYLEGYSAARSNLKVSSKNPPVDEAIGAVLEYLRGQNPDLVSGGQRNGDLRVRMKWIALGCRGPLRSTTSELVRPENEYLSSGGTGPHADAAQRTIDDHEIRRTEHGMQARLIDVLRVIYGLHEKAYNGGTAGYRWIERADEVFCDPHMAPEYSEHAVDLPPAFLSVFEERTAEKAKTVSNAEPSAWRYRNGRNSNSKWTVQKNRPDWFGQHDSHGYVLEPLYAAPLVDETARLRAENSALTAQVEGMREALEQALGSLKALGAERGYASEAITKALAQKEGGEGVR
ncbi:hypothetical protein D2T29_12640 [Sinirhodobacter populi]|uniref:Uncharacterized protein n=1 Tax=Paenirhodobacter populi TaxID=2306993 RepID=A0A443KCZ7_9RHOB|nr:hypothetical protein [Sinirhodobacter populi]RWR30512.1 hypothetical protein D2T29_12640 [Sinirhodobacter populi]